MPKAIQNASKSWVIQNKSDKVGELILYGPISGQSWWGDEVTPKSFIKDLRDLGDVDEIVVRINSGGGCVFAATTMYSLLKSHAAKKTVYIDGLAASAATIVAMAGDVIKMPGNAFMMIHDPLTGVWGNVKAITKTLKVLEAVKEAIIIAYQQKTGKSHEDLFDIMDKETWLNGQEAVDAGFADEVLGVMPIAASADGSDLVLNGAHLDIMKFQSGQMIMDQYLALQKGSVNMKFEDIMNALPEDQRTVILAYIEELKASNTPDPETLAAAQAEILMHQNQTTEAKAEVATLQARIQELEQKQKDPDEEMLNSLPENVKVIVLAERSKAAEAMKKMAEIENDMEIVKFKAVVDSLEKLPISADKMVPLFQNLSKSNKDGYEELVNLLTSINNSVEMGAVFATAGSVTSSGSSSLWDRLEAKIEQLMAADKSLTRASAMSMAFGSDPELYEEYRNSSYTQDGEEE